jgi:hypothetical protein
MDYLEINTYMLPCVELCVSMCANVFDFGIYGDQLPWVILGPKYIL